jgi:hypothetical protein
MKNLSEGLISVLLDTTAQFADRDDAAMDLGSFDEPEVENALLKIILNHNEDEVLVDSAGESLKEIWQRKGQIKEDLVKKMHPAARSYFD